MVPGSRCPVPGFDRTGRPVAEAKRRPWTEAALRRFFGLRPEVELPAPTFDLGDDYFIEYQDWRARRGLSPTMAQIRRFTTWQDLVLAREDMPRLLPAGTGNHG